MMKFGVLQKSITEVECDVLVVNVFEGIKEPGGATGALNKALDGAISALIERERFEGKLGQIVDMTPCGIPANRIVVVGLGKQEEFDMDRVRTASAAAARKAKGLSAKTVATVLHGGGSGAADPAMAAQCIVEGAMLGTYQFLKHKTVDVKPNTIEDILIVEADGSKVDSIKQGLAKGETIASAVNFARDLTNEPANVVNPTYLADQAKQIAKEYDMECRVFDAQEMKDMGMNLLLAVSQGSVEEPKFIVMKYTSPEASKTIALVGKGVTFDSGGLCIKSSHNMHEMKDDMSGAGAVLATMRAIAALKPKVNILGLLPTTENMPSGTAIRPGDIVKGYSGKTVEINNTDAEGRLILADAVAYAEKEGVAEIIDIATLTGACVVALGRGMAGILGSDQGIVDRLVAAGKNGGETLWQLPLFADYDDSLKSECADMRNAPGESGTITGALFIKRHIEKTPWAHIDIAGPCTTDKDSGTSVKGGSGFGVRTLINYVLEA